MKKKLTISIVAALFSGGMLLAPAMAHNVENEADSESTAENDNENTSENTNENTSGSSSETTSGSEADACVLLCGVNLLSGLGAAPTAETAPPGSAGTAGAELASGAARAAEAALAELYDRHGDAVFSLVERCTGDRLWAEHVTERVFAELWAEPHAFDPSGGSLRSHLIKAAYRHSAAAAPYAAQAEDDAEAPLWHQLHAEDRWAIGLTHFGEMTSKEVADALGVTEEAMTARIARGLRRVRDSDNR